MSRQRIVAAVAAVLVLAIAVYLVGARRGDRSRVDAETPGTLLGPPGRTGDVAGRVEAARVPAFGGTASSIETTARVRALRTIAIDGQLAFAVRARVGDEDGIVRAMGGSLRLTGRGMALAGAPLVVRRADAVVGASELPSIDGSPGVGSDDASIWLGTATAALTAPRVTFQPEGGGPRDVASPVTLVPPPGNSDPFEAVLYGTGLRWTDAPAELSVWSGGRSSVSWSGGGSVKASTTFGGATLGVSGKDVRYRVRRGPDGMELAGTGRFTQVFVDNVPQLRTTIDVELITPRVQATAGGRGSFTWAPRNTGDGVDLDILAIRPASDAARWVNLALKPMPAMRGGTPGPVVGGDTAGLRTAGNAFLVAGKARPIDAVVTAGRADRSDVTFDVPRGTAPGEYTIALLLTGNFPERRVEVAVTVT